MSFSGLRSLTFGYNFDQALDDVHFPESLEVLTLGTRHLDLRCKGFVGVLFVFFFVWQTG